jgi:hypothetical protein
MKDKLREILNTLLDDATTEDNTQRFYKLSDKDLIASINTFAEYFEPKQNRSTAQDVGSDSTIKIEYVLNTNDTAGNADERTEAE